MKINITDSSTGLQFVICAGGENSPLDDLDLAHTSSVQEVEFVRSEEIKLFDRKNARFDQTFTVLYKQSAIASGESGVLRIGSRCPRFGRVEFQTEVSFLAEKWYLHNASCQIVSARHIGTSALITYRIRGGRITQSASPPP